MVQLCKYFAINNWRLWIGFGVNFSRISSVYGALEKNVFSNSPSAMIMLDSQKIKEITNIDLWTVFCLTCTLQKHTQSHLDSPLICKY